MHTIQKSPGRAGRFVRRYWEDYAFIAPYLLLFIVFTIVPVSYTHLPEPAQTVISSRTSWPDTPMRE